MTNETAGLLGTWTTAVTQRKTELWCYVRITGESNCWRLDWRWMKRWSKESERSYMELLRRILWVSLKYKKRNEIIRKTLGVACINGRRLCGEFGGDGNKISWTKFSNYVFSIFTSKISDNLCFLVIDRIFSVFCLYGLYCQSDIM